MNRLFLKNIYTTWSFFLLRLFASVVVGVFYIFIAGVVQYWFVAFLGESTFNYIVAGLLSLFVGIPLASILGSLLFIFIKGWHVAALAYVPKILACGASAFDVGVRAFNKNLVTFGAVYGARQIIKGLLSEFKTEIWSLADGVHVASALKQFAHHPIVEYIAGDILHYSYDAAVFYLVKNKPKDINEVPSVIVEAAKRYLYCLPSIMITSAQTYVLFRFLPKLLKWLLILYLLFTKGLLTSILLGVLIFPLDYILDNAIFDPLTMIAFLSVYGKKAREPVDDNNPVVRAVNAIISGAEVDDAGYIDKDSPDSPDGEDLLDTSGIIGDEEDSIAESKDRSKAEIKTPNKSSPGVVTSAPAETEHSDAELLNASLASLSTMFKNAVAQDQLPLRRDRPKPEDDISKLPFDTEPIADLEAESGEIVRSGEASATEEDVNPFSSNYADIFKALSGLNVEDMESGILGDEYVSDEDNNQAKNFLAGDE